MVERRHPPETHAPLAPLPVRSYPVSMARFLAQISPSLDLVFKAIMGDPAHTHVLLDFLNCVLAPENIVHVTLLNPTPFATLLEERNFTVDVLAEDSNGRKFQVEMQGWNHAALRRRMLWNWSKLFAGQLQKGEPHTALQGVVAIWLVDDELWPGEQWNHRFQALDVQSGKPLSGDLDIHVFELPKARKLHLEEHGEPGPLGGWIRFFTEAGKWTKIPKELQRPAMEVAMSTVEQFREDSRANLLYMLREEENRVRRTQQVALQDAEDALVKAQARLEAEQARVATVQARAEAEQARAEAEQARAEAEHNGRLEAEARADALVAELRALKARLRES